jgi:hypothetical protein
MLVWDIALISVDSLGRPDAVLPAGVHWPADCFAGLSLRMLAHFA